MKILLVYPDTDPLSIIPNKLINIEPLGLEYIAGALPDHDVAILDVKSESDWVRKLAEFQPDVVGVSGTVIHTYRMIEVLQKAKELNPRTFTLVGGTHATLMPGDFDHPAVDVVIPGHDVEAVREIVRNLERGISLGAVAGVYTKTGNGLGFTKPRQPLADLNSLPMPRRDLTARHRSRYFHLVWRPTALIVTSVGCPNRCNFCPCPALTGNRVLKRDPQLVREELLEIDGPYIYAGDDDIFLDYQHALSLYRTIKEAGIAKQYYVLSRVDGIVRHPDIFEKWAEIGLKKVFVGLESFRDEDLASLNKRSTVERNNRAIEILQRNNVDVLGAFIIHPQFTTRDFDSLLRYLDRMNIYYTEFTVLTPFPGTRFFDETTGQLLYTDRRMYDLAHSLFPTGLPVREFYTRLSRLYRRAYSPVRALRIRPTVSPFRRFGFLRLLPGMLSLLSNSRRAVRRLHSSHSSLAIHAPAGSRNPMGPSRSV